MWQSQLTSTTTTTPTSSASGVTSGSGVSSITTNASSISGLKNTTYSGVNVNGVITSSNGSAISTSNITTTPTSLSPTTASTTTTVGVVGVGSTVCASERGCDQGVTVTSACQVRQDKRSEEKRREGGSRDTCRMIVFVSSSSYIYRSLLIVSLLLLTSVCVELSPFVPCPCPCPCPSLLLRCWQKVLPVWGASRGCVISNHNSPLLSIAIPPLVGVLELGVG